MTRPAGCQPPPPGPRRRRACSQRPGELPDWVAGAARRWLPGGERTRDLIEQRVLRELEEAFEQSGARRAERRASGERRPAAADPVPGRSGGGGISLADEIDRLRALRDAGALTEEQYRRAVDRVVDAQEQHGPR